MEHNENDVLANIEGLSQSYTDANERLAKARGRLQALRTPPLPGGRRPRQGRSDPRRPGAASFRVTRTVGRPAAPLHERISVTRSRCEVAAKRGSKIWKGNWPRSVRQRRAALADAQQESAAAQAEVDRLRQDVADNQKQAQEFATHLNDYKALREDLDHLEGMHRGALDRLEKLQASERERAPRAELLEAAAPNQEPWRPNYRLDAAIGLAGSFAFGFSPCGSRTSSPARPRCRRRLLEHSWAPALLGREPVSPMREFDAPNIAQLPAPIPPPRELMNAEITALFVRCDG